MDSDMARAHGHHYEQDLVQQTGEGGGIEEAPGKTSVFKRMKAKAKKVKDSFGYKVHGHGNDGHGQVHDHEDEESGDDETVQPPTLGSPVYDSESPRDVAIGQEGKPNGPLVESPRDVAIGQEGKPKGPLVESPRDVAIEQEGKPKGPLVESDVAIEQEGKPKGPLVESPRDVAIGQEGKPEGPLVESPIDVAIGQEGKPKGPLVEDLDQHVCPGTFQTKVTDTDHLDPPSAIPPTLKFGTGDNASSGHSKPTEQSNVTEEPKQAPTDFDARYGEHWGSLEASTDGNDSGALKSDSGDVNQGHLKSLSGDVISPSTLDTTVGKVNFKSGRSNAASDDHNLETFNATPEDFTSGQGNAASGGFKSGDFNPKSENFNLEPFNANSGDFNSGRQNAASDDHNSEAFNVAPEDFTSGHLNVASGGFKSGDLNPKSDNFNSEPFNANSGDFNSGRQNAATDDHNSGTFNANPEDFTPGQLNTTSGGFKSGDFNPKASEAKTENFDSEPYTANSGDFSSESSKALGSGDFSSGSLRGASGGFSSFNSSHARATSGDLNSQSNTPTHDFGSELNTTSPAHNHHDVSPNYSTNITSPGGVGSEEAKVDPILSSFAKMGIHGDQQHEAETPSLKSGGHDEFCDKVESSPIPDFLSDKANTIPEHTESVPPVPENYSPKTESHAKDMDVDISYPKDVDVDAHHPQDMNADEVETPAETTNQGGYVASAAAALAAKIGYGGNDDKSSDAPAAEAPVGSTKSSDLPAAEAPVGSTDDAVTDRSPISTPQPQGGFVSTATSALTGTALSAKNAVASKLGYGGSDAGSTDDAVTDRSPISTPQPQSGYVSSATSALTGTTTLDWEGPHDSTDDVVTDRSPVETPQPTGGYVSTATSGLAGTAASAKNAVASKLGSGGNDDTTETARGIDETSGKTEPETETGEKGYMAPGEDAKALSNYFTSAFHKPKGVDEEEKPAPGVGQTVSDEERVSDQPKGKVTESEQVASRLGSSESEKTGVSSPGGGQSPSAGMVGKVKGAFTNWFGKAEETDASPKSPAHGTSEEHLQKGEL